MAHHGDMATSSSLLGLVLQPLGEVSLSAPRPSGERTTNEYVETPFRPGEAHHHALHLPINNNKRVVSTQPTTAAVATFKKDAPASAGQPTAGPATPGPSGAAGDCFRGSIICPECGRCRCESCRRPRPLPSRWLCNNACFCSAEASLDYATCLCCVKGLFYHCSKDGDGTSCADDPCSCAPHRLLARWGCLGVLSLILPCLWCYWPLRACVGLCEKCYARYSSDGCRCEPRNPKQSDVTPEKRLLDTSPDF